MALLLKTLGQVAIELGMPEPEIKAMAQMKKVRAVIKKGKLMFAPDEIAKLKRLRKSLPESALKSSAAEAAAQAQAQPYVPKPTPPKRPQPRTPQAPPRLPDLP